MSRNTWAVLCLVTVIVASLVAVGCGEKSEEVTPPAKPAEFEVSDLLISPTEAGIGETITVAALVKNVGGAAGTKTVTLKIDEVEVETEDITLEGGQTKMVSFTLVRNIPGTCSIEVDGLSGTAECVNRVSWNTAVGSLEADNFYLVANGETYYAAVADVEVGSDPGHATSCSLEIEWHEKGVEMRLHIHFRADAEDWWSDEIRTYDGQPDGEWICYTGDFFRSSLGTPFSGTVQLESDPDNDYAGEIHFDNLRLQVPLAGGTGEAARETEKGNVQMAVWMMMAKNSLSTIPNPVSGAANATNDMSAFPDTTSDDDTNGDKATDPDGNAYTIVTGNDLAGYVLYDHDMTADNSATPVVNYMPINTTEYYYTVDADGTVHQWDAPGGTEYMG